MYHFTTRVLLATLLITLLISPFLSLAKASFDPVETRYMRSDTHIINGVSGYKLSTTQSSSYASLQLPSWSSGNYLYVKVYKVDTNGASTLITSGAQVSATATGLLSATISIPTTVLGYYYAVKVEVWHYGTKETLVATFITEQLGAKQLDSATWTVSYYVYKSSTKYYFRFGTSTYNSNIANFSWTSPTWNNISSLTFTINTKKWNFLDSLTINLLTKKWNPLATLNFQVLTKAWHPINILNFQILTKAWLNLDWLNFNILTKKWNLIDILNFNFQTKTWHILDTLNFIMQTLGRAWHLLATVTFTLQTEIATFYLAILAFILAIASLAGVAANSPFKILSIPAVIFSLIALVLEGSNIYSFTLAGLAFIIAIAALALTISHRE